MALTRDKSEGTVFDPVRGLRGGPFKNPNYYKGHAAHQRPQRRIHDPDPVPLVAPRPDRRHRLGRPGRPGHVLLCPLLRRGDRHPQVVHGRRPFRPQPRVGPLGLRLRRLPHPGRLQRRHRGRQGGPEEMGGRRPRPHRRDRRPAGDLYKQKSPGGGQVRHRLLPQQRPERRRRLVEARRRPAGSNTTTSASTTPKSAAAAASPRPTPNGGTRPSGPSTS